MNQELFIYLKDFVNFLGWTIIIFAFSSYIYSFYKFLKKGKKEKINWFFKNIFYPIQLIFLIVIFELSKHILFDSKYLTSISSIRLLILLILMYMFVSFILKEIEYRKICKNVDKNEPKYKDAQTKSIHKNFPLLFISPDIFFSRLHKSKVVYTEEKERKEKKGKLIRSFNLWSFISSIVILIILVFLNCLNLNILNCVYIKILLTYRFISRSVEIIFAFIQDITEDKKSSNLNSSQRVLLAFTSLFELLILVTSILYLRYTNLSESIMQTFSLLIQLDCTTNGYYINTIKILANIATFTLLGMVLSSYLSSGHNQSNGNNTKLIEHCNSSANQKADDDLNPLSFDNYGIMHSNCCMNEMCTLDTPVLMKYNSNNVSLLSVIRFEQPKDGNCLYILNIKVTNISHTFEVYFEGKNWCLKNSTNPLIKPLSNSRSDTRFKFNNYGNYQLRFFATINTIFFEIISL